MKLPSLDPESAAAILVLKTLISAEAAAVVQLPRRAMITMMAQRGSSTRGGDEQCTEARRCPRLHLLPNIEKKSQASSDPPAEVGGGGAGRLGRGDSSPADPELRLRRWPAPRGVVVPLRLPRRSPPSREEAAPGVRTTAYAQVSTSRHVHILGNRPITGMS